MLFALPIMLRQQILHYMSCRLRRVHDGHVRRSQTPQQRFDQWIMSATQNESSGGVAGNHKHLRTLLIEKPRRFYRILGYRLSRFGPIRQASRVTEVEVIGVGDKFK